MSSTEAEEEVYDVEKIVGDRTYKGKRQFLIKWVGYPDSQNTWELEDNLMCEELLKEYIESKNKNSIPEKKAVKGSAKKETIEKKERIEKPAIAYPPSSKPAFERKITNEWDDSIVAVIGAHMNYENLLEIEFILKDDTKAIALAEEMRYKAPIKLIEFYEENLSLTE